MSFGQTSSYFVMVLYVKNVKGIAFGPIVYLIALRFHLSEYYFNKLEFLTGWTWNEHHAYYIGQLYRTAV